MIISREHSFIFLHNRKTAGSSISVSLSRYLGPDDLQISAIPETLSAGLPLTERVLREANKQAHGLLPLFRLLGKRAYARAVARSIDHAYRPLLGRKPPHAPAATVAAAFPEDWAACRKFCVVRNPWDKTVSDHFWRIKGIRNPPTFDAYVRALAAGDSLNGIVPIEFHSNWELYTINDTVIADHVVRFENLAEELQTVLQSLGLDWDGWLPRAKGGTRKTSKRSGGYRDMYDAETAAIVGNLYAREAETFGYTF
ncbi:hypothetical protein [Ostreiculturibacter nitratireducens]|uniref:hypothetical protein n=1 Tax=Ostreiculturibacter nitratireducens TaxID=3075226 RepID=UPI0031B57C97